MDFKQLNENLNQTLQSTMALVTSRLKNFSLMTMAEKIAYPIAFCGCFLAFIGLVFIILGI